MLQALEGADLTCKYRLFDSVYMILDQICVRTYVRVKSGSSNICRTETIHGIKLYPLRHLFRMTSTTTYPKIIKSAERHLLIRMVWNPFLNTV